MSDHIEKILSINKGIKLAVQAVGETHEELYQSFNLIRDISSDIIVKIPINAQGIMAIKKIKSEKTNTPIMSTAILNSYQLWISGLLCANYSAVYFSKTSLSELNKISELYRNCFESSHEAMIASIKSLEMLYDSQKLFPSGSVTLSFSLFNEIVSVKTNITEYTDTFNANWKESGNYFSKGDSNEIK